MNGLDVIAKDLAAMSHEQALYNQEQKRKSDERAFAERLIIEAGYTPKDAISTARRLQAEIDA